MDLQLETKRLILRPLELSDAQEMFDMNKNPNVHKYLWQTPEKAIDESIKVIEYVQKQYSENNIGRFATILKETGDFVGWTGIKFVNDHIADNTYTIIVMGDKTKLDISYLQSIGEFKELTLEEIFGY